MPEADRRVGGEAADARAAGKFVYGLSEDLGAEDILALCEGELSESR